MTGAGPRHRQARAGFTLVEALVAIALMGLIIGALVAVTSQWVPNWRRGLERVQGNEQVAIALDRLTADLSAAEFVTPNREVRRPLFDGEELAVTFVRTAIGPNLQPGLEIVRVYETVDGAGWALVRARAPFAPLAAASPTAASVAFSDPVVLLRAPFRVTFAYAGYDGGWKATWKDATGLPAVVRVTVRDAASERALAISTAARVHVDRAAPARSE